MSTVAQIIAQTLAEAGIETVFGLPGGENSELMDALRQAGLRFVLVRNESSAVFMADVQARLTGKPGVALTTLGPGAANAYAGIAHAWLDRAPVLVITAQTPRRLLDHHTHQVLDTQAVMRPVTKHTEELTHEQVAARVRHALALTMDGRPGVVHLGLSSETAGLTAHDEAAASPCCGVAAASSSPAQLQQIEAAFAKAKRSVLVLGLGLEPEQPYAVLLRLAEALDVPIIVTPKAKGAVPDDHPLSAGVIGLTRTDPAYEILDEADLIIAVGFDVVELVKPWQQAAPLIWLANWANVDPTIPAIVEWVGLVAPVLAHMATRLAPQSPTFQRDGWGAQRVTTFRQKLAARVLPSPQPGRLLPQTVLQVLRHATPRDIFVSTDVGSHKILSALTWPTYTPNRYMLSNGLSSMGFGLPAAAAAALTLKQPTLCITGDAGMAMVLGELGLVAELGLPVITVIMNDNALDLIRSHQKRLGKRPYGVEFANPDWMQIASAFGIAGYRASSEAALQAAIEAALAHGKPALIEAIIDPISYPTTPKLA